MENLNQRADFPKSLAAAGKRRRSDHTLTRNDYIELPPKPSAHDPNDERGSGGLLEYWTILRQHRGTWIIFAFVFALLGFLITLPQTPTYQARTSIEILGLNDNFLNLKESNPLTETGSTLETSDIQTQVKILQSESLLGRVVSKLQSKQSAAPEVESRVSTWRKVFNLPAPPAANPRAQTLWKIAGSLRVRAAGETRIIEATVDSTNPQLAADFANTLANEFIEQNLESRWKTTERTSDWLTRQLDDMRIKLEHSEDALQVYARSSGLIFTDEKTNVSEDKLRQLQAELSTAQGERIAKQSRYETAQNSPPDALPDVLNDAGLRDTQTKITELRRQLAELGTVYTPEYSKVKKVQAQISTLQAAFDRDRSAILSRIKDEYEEASRKEKLLSSAYDAQTRVVSGDGEKSIQYNILKREVDSNRQLYETMLQQLKQSTIASAMRASNVRVVDPAKAPSSPYKPNARESAGLGLLSGIFLGALFIIIRERADRTIQQPGDSNYYLNVPELGIIPAGNMGGAKHAERLPLSKKLQIGADAAVSAEALSNRVELVTWQRKPSMVAESFRSTLISIFFASENGTCPKLLVLTSPSPGEGKSTVASNLAIAIAEVGQRILLIDADMRRPRLHEIFELENERGLSSILRERTGLNGDKSIGGAIRPTKVPGLFVLPSGPGTSTATNLLYGSYMAELMTYVREEFDVVLLDTPPMLQIPDARVVARMADSVIMVIRAGHTTRDAALAAQRRFSEDGTEVLGTILNDWNPKAAPNGYYGYYGAYRKYYDKHQRA